MIVLPANATPEYNKAEERYQQARTLEEKIKSTEEVIRLAPKHKGAEKLLKTLKRRLSKLRMELEKKQEKRVGRGGGPSFAVKKEGAFQIALVGLPNSGKSKLLERLTGARPEVADYPFTTTVPIPGMLQFEDAQIQLVEIPAIDEGSSTGRGLGAQPLSVARNADAIALAIDTSVDQVRQAKILIGELDASGIKLNRKAPKINTQHRFSGGIEIKGAEMIKGGEAEIKHILQDHSIHNAIVTIEEPVTIDDFKDILQESTVYLRGFIVLTKLDITKDLEGLERLKSEFGDEFKILHTSEQVDNLKRKIYEKLDLIRIYTKRSDEQPAKRPLVLPRGSTVFDIAHSVHRDFKERLKFAKVWGSAKFPGQQVPRNYVLGDKDVVELHI